MTPGSFDLDTCKEVLGDAHCRLIEDNARACAEGKAERSYLQFPDTTYFDRVSNNMCDIVWQAAYEKRKARLERMRK